jgi:hypothetical protein
MWKPQMANPQPTPFVQFSKELFDALLRSGMPATHKEIVLAVIRRTYGDHGRKSAPISQSLLQQMTGRNRNGVRMALRALIDEGVIVEVAKSSYSSAAVLALNKDYELWGKWSVDSATVLSQSQELGEVHHDGGGEVHHDGGGEVHHDGGGEVHHDGPIEYIETLETGDITSIVQIASAATNEEGREEEPPPKKRKATKPPPGLERFEEFWELYPRKVAVGKAREKWGVACKKDDPDTIIDGLKRQRCAMMERMQMGEPQFVPHASTWLNQERWRDESPGQRSILELVDEAWGGGP